MSSLRPLQLMWLAPLVIVVVGLLGVVPLLRFALAQGGDFTLDARVLHVTQFTVWQALLSTAFSVVPAIAVARALARQRFFGRSALLSLMAVPQSLPVIVAVLSIVSFYGAAGPFGGLFSVYGLPGIVLTHVFFNLPLSTLMLHRAIAEVPPESHRLAAQLAFNDSAIFRHVDWPAMRSVLPRVCALVFLLCAASFITVLTLGGPAATTLEVAIYQSLRTDFDVAQAISLSAVQVALSGVLMLVLGRFAAQALAPHRIRLSQNRHDGTAITTRVTDLMVLALACALILPPMVLLLVSGAAVLTFSASLAQAFVTSCVIAVCSAALTLGLSWCLARLITAGGRLAKLATAAMFAGLVVPPAVMATGWYLAAQTLAGGVWLAVAMIVTLNALMALPFATSVLAAGFASLGESHEKLCHSLGLSGFARLRHIDGPALKAVIAQSALLAFALSFGDLTAVTLLGNNGIVTLPSLVAEQMGHFQSREAGGTALLLALLCFGASWLAQRAGQRQ